jgi:ABC-type Fe3+ transport system substrate-binding protein
MLISLFRSHARFSRLSGLLLGGLLFAGGAEAQQTAPKPAQTQNWQKAWADAQARAKGQTLVVTVHPNAANLEVVRVFQKRFPQIKVQVTEMSANRLAPRILKEQKAGIYSWDVWMGTTANMNDLILPSGGFDSLDPYLILPEVIGAEHWRAPQFRYSTPEGHYVFLMSLPYSHAIFVNTDRLQGVQIKTAQDLLNPKLKGKIGIRDPSRPNAGAISLGGIIKPMGDKGPAFLRALFTQMGAAVMDNPRQITNAIMRGDKAVIIGAEVDVIYKCKLSGGCRNVQTLDIGADIILPRGVAVLKNAPHKDATKVWVNWLLSKEGQEAYVKAWVAEDTSGAVSQRKDVAPHPSLAGTLPDFNHPEKLLLSGMGVKDEAFTHMAMKVFMESKNRAR